MLRDKILRNHSEKIIYSEENWNLLKVKRDKGIKLLEIFVKEGFNPYICGSVARGDVHSDSDIDIVFTHQIPSFRIEYILSNNGFKRYNREIIMATPGDSIKLYIHLSEFVCITIPMTKLGIKGIDFYDFAGKVDLNQLKSNMRVSGVDKRLVMIKPNAKGHEEYSIINNESESARELGVSIDIVYERIRVLLKRERYGRTGVFLKRLIQSDEFPEEILRKLAKKKSIIRRKLIKR
jgi:predicted nucleotidyltransferase